MIVLMNLLGVSVGLYFFGFYQEATGPLTGLLSWILLVVWYYNRRKGNAHG